MKDENKRLENELIFANKCLNVLNKIRVNLNEILSLKTYSKQIILNNENIKKFKDLDEEYNYICSQNECKSEVNDEINEQFVISSNTSTKLSPNNQTMSSLNHKIPINVNKNYKQIESLISDNGNQSLTTTNTSEVNVIPIKQNNRNYSRVLKNSLQSVEEEVCAQPLPQRSEVMPNNNGESVSVGQQSSKSIPIKVIFLKPNQTIPVLKSPLIPTTALLKRIADNRSIGQRVNPIHEEVISSSTQSSDSYESELTYDKLYYKCLLNECNKHFEIPSDLHRHQIESHKDVDRNNMKEYQLFKKYFKCGYDLCGKEFKDMSHIRKHITGVHMKTYKPKLIYDKLYYKCSLKDCIQKYKSISELNRHQTESHSHIDRNSKTKSEIYSKVFKCEYDLCGKEFYKLEGIKFHIRSAHMNDYKFKCDYHGCGKMFKFNITLKSHQNNVHNEGDSIMCDHLGCGKLIKNRKYLLKHKLEVHSNRPLFSCDYENCTYSSKYKTSLEMHQKYTHSNDRPFLCDVNGCEKRYKTKVALNLHLNAHKNLTKVICPINGCGKHVMPHRLRAHISLHSQEDLCCDWKGCHYKSKFERNLKIHKQVVHSSERSHICSRPDCGKRFKCKPSLLSHMKTHSKDKKYSCDWPGCAFRTHFSQHITEHMRTHTKEKPFACEWPGCEYRCAIQHNLKNHFKVHQK